MNHVFWRSFPIASIFTSGLYKLNNVFPMEHVFGKRLLLISVKLVYQLLNFLAVIGRIEALVIALVRSVDARNRSMARSETNSSFDQLFGFEAT